MKGRKYIGSPVKYYFTDMGLRNARLNFRQLEETHTDELKQTTVKYDLYSCFGELEDGTCRLTLSDISVEFSLPFTDSSDTTE